MYYMCLSFFVVHLFVLSIMYASVCMLWLCQDLRKDIRNNLRNNMCKDHRGARAEPRTDSWCSRRNK